MLISLIVNILSFDLQELKANKAFTTLRVVRNDAKLVGIRKATKAEEKKGGDAGAGDD